jgi:Ca-activated chloride channel family protein
MIFLWPHLLWLMLILPLLVVGYMLLLKRRKKMMLRYASLGLVKEAMGSSQAWKRHVPPVLFFLAIAAALLAAARPTALITMPGKQQTIVMAMDVSISMRATDVEPNRMVAAQRAARSFIQELPSDVSVGIVTFAGTAAVSQQPTDSREDLLDAIDRFQLQGGTAIGSGIALSLATLFPDAGIDLAGLTYATSGANSLQNSARSGPAKPPETPAEPGSHDTGAIILLTDGQQTAGIDMMMAARMAAERGVRVYTVGVGTPDGGDITFDGWSMRVELDEASLKEVARITQGEYFYASTTDELKKVYDSLNSRLVFEKKEFEVTALFALAAALLSILSAGLSVFWFNRIL